VRNNIKEFIKAEGLAIYGNSRLLGARS